MPTSIIVSDEVPRPCVCTAIKKIARVLGRTYDASLASSPMNVTQLAVLRCIQRRQGEPLMRVARELELDRSSLYRALSPMIRKRWIRIKPGTDLRSRSALITHAGYAALEKAGTRWEEIQTRIVDKFGRARWARFVEDVEALADSAVLAANRSQDSREDD